MRFVILEIPIIFALLTGCSTAGFREEPLADNVTTTQQKKIDAEIKELSKKLNERPDNANNYRKLAHLYRSVGTPASRARALTLIEKAIRLDPDEPENHLEKALILMDGEFYKLAENELNKLIELGKNRSRAYYLLGKIEEIGYLKKCFYKVHLERAIDFYKRAVVENPDDYQTLLHLASCYLMNERYEKALASALRCTSIAPKSKEAHLLAGTAALRLRRFALASEEFSNALHVMDRDERNFYEDISFLLPEESRELYLSSSDQKRDEWNKRFWMENDPTPSTSVNERHMEHYSRIFMADMLFSVPKLNLVGAHSDRGRAYIRFGPPDSISIDMGSSLEGSSLTWYYKNEDEPLMFTFMDEFLNGNYHFPISERTGEINAELASTAPPLYIHPVKLRKAIIYSSLFQRKASGCLTALEHSLAFPTNKENIPSRLEVTYTIFDGQYNRIKSQSLIFSTDTLPTIIREGKMYDVISFSDSIAPFEGRLLEAIEVKDARDSLKGIVKENFDLIKTCEAKPALSTIKLSIPQEGICTGILDPIPSYKEGGNLCIEYRIYNLKKGSDRMSRYAITYSIKNIEKITGLYAKGLKGTIIYVLRKLKTKDLSNTIVSSSFERSISSDNSTDRLKINTKGLKPGPYELTITVKDLVAGRTAERETTFKILKE